MTKKEAIVKSICGYIDAILAAKDFSNEPKLVNSLKQLRIEMLEYQSEVDNKENVTEEDVDMVDFFIEKVDEIQKGLDKEYDELSMLKSFVFCIKVIITE